VIAPTAGAVGTPLQLSGSGFGNVAGAVYFTQDGAAFAQTGSGLSGWADAAIGTTVPTGLAGGSVSVAVYTAGGLRTNAVSFTINGAPAVTGVLPTVGPASGGTMVTVTGTGFALASGHGTAQVFFGTVPARSVTVDSDTRLVATAPAGTGTVDITVHTTYGTSAASPQDLFSYAGQPTVTGLRPAEALISGGIPVTVTGTGFEAGGHTLVRQVSFGGTPATGVTVESPTTLVASAPPGAVGTVAVTVTTLEGTSATGNADLFNYVTAPVLAPPQPDAAPAGSTVTLSGSGFGTVAGTVYWRQGSETVSETPSGFSWAPTRVTASVPVALSPGTVTVAVYNATTGLASNAQNFTVTAVAGPPPVYGVDSGGGHLATADGACALTIPAGDVLAGGTLTLTDSDAPPAGIPAGFTAASPVCVLGGARLRTPVPITVQDGAGALGRSPQRFSVYVETAGNWVFAPTASQGDTATALVTGDESVVVLGNLRKFPDVPAGYWAAAPIDVLQAADVLQGFPNGTFQPDASVTRAQFVTMLVRTLGLPVGAGTTGFSDVPADAWFAPYVAAGVRAGIVAGTTPTTFDPQGVATREEMAVMLARALKLTGRSTLAFSDAGQIAPWALSSVEAVVAAGYMQGFPGGTFQPLGVTTRAQAAQVLARVIAHMAP
jgi:hypothetical protein